MATFSIKCSKNKAQDTITVKQTDSVDLSTVSAIVVSMYTNDLATADNTYTLDATELSNFKSNGTVDLSVLDVLGSATPSDDYYSLELNGDSGSYLSNKAGVAITLEAYGKVLNKQGFVDVYSPDYRIDQVLYTALMLVTEMDNIEEQSSSFSKRVDFTTRHALLKQILNYS